MIIHKSFCRKEMFTNRVRGSFWKRHWKWCFLNSHLKLDLTLAIRRSPLRWATSWFLESFLAKPTSCFSGSRECSGIVRHPDRWSISPATDRQKHIKQMICNIIQKIKYLIFKAREAKWYCRTNLRIPIYLFLQVVKNAAE